MPKFVARKTIEGEITTYLSLSGDGVVTVCETPSLPMATSSDALENIRSIISTAERLGIFGYCPYLAEDGGMPQREKDIYAAYGVAIDEPTPPPAPPLPFDEELDKIVVANHRYGVECIIQHLSRMSSDQMTKKNLDHAANRLKELAYQIHQVEE